jgi:hypothetical protein
VGKICKDRLVQEFQNAFLTCHLVKDDKVIESNCQEFLQILSGKDIQRQASIGISECFAHMSLIL